MRAYIKKLQSKEEHIRKQILVASLVVSMSVAGLVWAYSLGARFNSQSSVQANNDIKPFKVFGGLISDTYSGISASVGNISFSKGKDEKPEKQIQLIPVEHTANQ